MAGPYLFVQVFSLGGFAAMAVSSVREPAVIETGAMRILTFHCQSLLIHGVVKRRTGWPLLRGEGQVYLDGKMRSFRKSLGTNPVGTILIDGRAVRT